MEGWRSSGEVDAQDGDSRTSVYKALRLCTDYRVFTDSGARGGGGAGGPPPRIAGTLEGWSCYKYVAWCGGNQRAFHDLSTEPYDLRDRWVAGRWGGVRAATGRTNEGDCKCRWGRGPRKPSSLMPPDILVGQVQDAQTRGVGWCAG